MGEGVAEERLAEEAYPASQGGVQLASGGRPKAAYGEDVVDPGTPVGLRP